MPRAAPVTMTVFPEKPILPPTRVHYFSAEILGILFVKKVAE
jgi:hypothetical protein